jgi:drug/metabolite transporter (DMT)-like permease
VDISIRRNQFFVLFFLSLIWGSSFILIKKSLLTFDAYQTGALRIAIASLALLPFSIKHLKSLKEVKWYYFFLAGLLGNGSPAVLFSLAQTQISSSLSGFTNSLTPLFALLIGYFLFNQVFNPNKIKGILLGLTGAALLIIGKDLSMEAKDIFYWGFAVLGSLCYGFSVNIIKNKLQHVEPIAVTSIAFLLLLPFAIFILSISDLSTNVQSPNLVSSFLSVVFLGIIGTAFSVYLFNRLIKHTTAVFAASTTYIIPIFALLWGLFDAESVSILQISGIGLILFGVYLTNK